VLTPSRTKRTLTLVQALTQFLFTVAGLGVLVALGGDGPIVHYVGLGPPTCATGSRVLTPSRTKRTLTQSRSSGLSPRGNMTTLGLIAGLCTVIGLFVSSGPEAVAAALWASGWG
jgi:hypothetical protein